MAGNDSEPGANTDWHRLGAGAVSGALIVVVLAGSLGALIEGVAHPIALLGFAVLGAVLGAYAWSVVAYEHEHTSPQMSGPAELPAGPEAERRPSGLGWLWRKHAASFARLPLSPWI